MVPLHTLLLLNIRGTDYKRQKTALDKCWYCYRNEGQTLPEAPLVSLAYRVYLALPVTTELTPGHCLIVPVEHCSSVLELDDDTWDEIRVISVYSS